MSPPRSLRADNPGPFTLDGTRTWIVGRREAAVVDPGPDLPRHVRAVAQAVAGARTVRIVVTHGHDDHAGAVDTLLEALPGADVVGAGHPAARPLEAGDVVPTDAGSLVAVPTPGHTRDHLCLHWPERAALFAGDLVLGQGDTTWVGEYAGCVADYLASLERVASLPLVRIHPAHGPDLDDPPAVWERYRRHRLDRVRQVREALRDAPGATTTELMTRVYGTEIPAGLQGAALASLEALVEYARSHSTSDG